MNDAIGNIDLDHWDSYSALQCNVQYTIVIPSFDRPQTLCNQTLSWLRSQQIDESRIVVLVAPGRANIDGSDLQEWERYVETTRAEGFGNIRIRAGGVGLCAQMIAGMQMVGVGNYMVVISDTVKCVKRHSAHKGKRRLMPIASGQLLNIISHGLDLLKTHGFVAWSSVANHNAMRMEPLKVSRRLGLLDGNFMGMIVPNDFQSFASLPDQIFYVALTTRFWNDGHRICRYLMLSCDHRYRLSGGQASHYPDAQSRRRAENIAIRNLSNAFPLLVKFAPSPKGTLKTMQFKFTIQGLGPMNMMRRKNKGRPRSDRSTSSKDRMRTWRSRTKR
jgi:hypothetical protein